MSISKDNPLKSLRFYKVKNPTKNFICALCRAPRQMKYTKNLNWKNYLQLLVLTACASYLLFPFVGLKGLYVSLLLWPAIEMSNKLLYRKEIPCPYCGFDATWYRRDVKVARKKVEQFWSTNYPELTEKKEQLVQNLAPANEEPSLENTAEN
ncbi:MAG: hypothetical protein KC478_11080 [Bacteriovoracaceae bacterium]|nr:hypothetical protein [Bacteriovoracaceae bacterium]